MEEMEFFEDFNLEINRSNILDRNAKTFQGVSQKFVM